MSYTLLNGNYILRDDDHVLVPEDPLNADWAAYQVWLAAGNVPNPVPAIAPPARTATAKQIRYALTDLGVRDAWEAAAGPGKATQAVQDWWGWTDPIAEDAAKLARLCKAVGITPAALLDKAVGE